MSSAPSSYAGSKSFIAYQNLPIELLDGSFSLAASDIPRLSLVRNITETRICVFAEYQGLERSITLAVVLHRTLPRSDTRSTSLLFGDGDVGVSYTCVPRSVLDIVVAVLVENAENPLRTLS